MVAYYIHNVLGSSSNVFKGNSFCALLTLDTISESDLV